MIVLRPTNLHWLDGLEDSWDLCAHSPVEFRIGHSTLVNPASRDWCVSAAALYLLRTLQRQHSSGNRVAEHLFPCCGHAMYEDNENPDDVLIVGCCNGIDFDVFRSGDDVAVTSSNGSEYRVTVVEWVEAVCGFSDAVEEFYQRSAPKQLDEDWEERGYRRFRAEWSRRRDSADALLGK